MDTATANHAATVIIGQRVRAGAEAAFETWQKDLNCAAADYPGFLAAEVTAPTTVQPDWVIVYRFDSIAHVQAWINSATRQEYLNRGAPYFDGPATQQVISGGSQPVDPLVTMVVTHRVDPDDVDDFLAWQDRLHAAEATFEGFRGSELFRPVEGLQDEWTALYRFDNAAHLDTWLTSSTRQDLLAAGAAFDDFELHTIDNSFGNWFAFTENGQPAPPPSSLKSAIAVWVGLYPTVMVLSLTLSPLKLPLWMGLLVGNLLSSLVMSFFTMRFYVNPLLARWLHPPAGAPRAQVNARGLAVVGIAIGFWVAVFFLVTARVWTLP